MILPERTPGLNFATKFILALFGTGICLVDAGPSGPTSAHAWIMFWLTTVTLMVWLVFHIGFRIGRYIDGDPEPYRPTWIERWVAPWLLGAALAWSKAAPDQATAFGELAAYMAPDAYAAVTRSGLIERAIAPVRWCVGCLVFALVARFTDARRATPDPRRDDSQEGPTR